MSVHRAVLDNRTLRRRILVCRASDILSRALRADGFASHPKK
jgi:hypothetical protein